MTSLVTHCLISFQRADLAVEPRHNNLHLLDCWPEDTVSIFTYAGVLASKQACYNLFPIFVPMFAYHFLKFAVLFRLHETHCIMIINHIMHSCECFFTHI